MLMQRCHVQVYTSKQLASAWVYAYPTMHRAYKVVDALAAVNCEPSMEQLMEDSSMSDAQIARNWEHVVAYTQTVTPRNVHQHVPFTSYFVSHAMQGVGSTAAAVLGYSDGLV